MPRLTINPGVPGTLEVQLKPGINSFGRGPANDFKIENPSVSGSHCQIIVEQGRTVIRDLGSTNGTFVNRAPVKEAILQPGQIIHLAEVQILFQDGPAAAQAPGQTEVLAAPRIPVATAIPVQPKPIIATPAAAPAPIVAIPVAPRPVAPVSGASAAPAPIVATPVPPPGAPAPIKPFPLPGAPSPAIPAAPVPSAVPVAAPVAIPTARSVAPIPTATVVPVATAVPTAAPAVPIELPPKPYAPPSGLRLSGSSHTVIVEAPPPIPEQPSAPEVPISTTSPAYCKHHPKTLGRHFCNSCHQFYCDMCVGSRNVGGTKVKTCRHCGTDVTAVQVKLQKPVQIGFFKRIPGAFAYPVRGAGVFIILVGIFIVLGLRLGGYMAGMGSFRTIGAGIILQMLAGGYLFTFLQSIIHSTVAEDKELPDLPGMSNFVEDIVLPFFRLLGLTVICFGPAIGLAIFAVINGEMSEGLRIAVIATAVLGGIYFPLAFLAVAVLDSIGAANPLVIIPSMLKVPLEYFVTILFLAGVLGFRTLGDFLIGAIFPRGWTTHSMGELFAMIGAQAFWGFFGYYLLIVTVHVLGLLYVSKKDKLGWLDR